MDTQMGDHSNKAFWGIVFVLFGLLFLARNLGYIDLHYTVRTYWPVIVILIGLNIVVRSYIRMKKE
jgi:uncharacterized integral membrane protein